jgi:acetyl-CoA carboxylase, biotin carboxylase subunit
MPISRLLIANRGEIAVRVQRAARELGMRVIQAHSLADTDSLAVRMADETVNIGPPSAAKSYLNAAAIIEAARATGADAIHPGYGFLSENAAFADAVEAAGLIFVGPRGDTIRTMGDKAAARAAAQSAGVPVVPGSEGTVADVDEARHIAEAISYPLMIKAAAGGGGRGIRVVETPAGLEAAFDQAAAEAKAAFGDGALYLEKFIGRARHIEVQILGDGTEAVHLYERECSIQRRRQKIWEEAPAAVLTPAVRERLCASAVALAKSVGYRGAGTLEYLYDDESGDFYFIEMNTRIQVEHPVTEMITGVDLVREMLRIAGGEPLRLSQGDISPRGHAIEARINAEDPDRDFRPSPGLVTGLHVPGGPGARFDSLLYAGYSIPPFYDSLIGKLIVWDQSREAALSRMRRALDELKVDGIATTTPLHRRLVEAPDVVAGVFHTRWLEQWLAAAKSREDAMKEGSSR